MQLQPKRCWNVSDPLYIEYHDKEWGVPVHNDAKLYEFLVLDGFQAGLTWLLILQRRPQFRDAFDHFDPEKVAKYNELDVKRLMQTPGVVHNEGKVRAAIANAQGVLQTQWEFGSFDHYIWSFVKGKTIHNHFTSLSEMPAKTPESEAMSQDLKSRGFKFVGPTICYAFMQAAGLVNDHLTCCFRHNQLTEL